ncbi:MAG: hypothetical protein NPIRA03_05750 [Nitrospirales bacterium]|nr:MAG: hypothetical protein NPIRA03_05750 [Nitrospirales bacterium]
MKNLETALKRIRQARGLPIPACAKQGGVHYVTLARIEKKIYDPHLSRLRKLPGAIAVTVPRVISDQPITSHTHSGGMSLGTDRMKGRMVREVSYCK